MKTAKTLGSAYCEVFQKYFTFSGRASHYDFWAFRVVDALVIIALSLLSVLFSRLFVLVSLYNLITFIPSLSLLSRRLHDRGNSFWLWGSSLLLIVFGTVANAVDSYHQTAMGWGRVIFTISALISMVLFLYVWILACLQGDDKANKYGAAIEEKAEVVSRGKWFMAIYLTVIFVSFVLSFMSKYK